MSNLNPELVNDAATLASELFGAATANNEDTRDTGLILTKDQIKDLKRYEMAGLALPITLKTVEDYLGYTDGAGRGLEPPDFLKTFKIVHGHASLWNPLRTDLLSSSDKLVVFAGSIQVYSQSMEEVFSDIAALRLADQYDINTLEDLKRVEAERGKFPDIQASDRQDLGYYLDEIFKKVREQEVQALAIKKRLDHFGSQLSREVIPAIKLKLAAIDNNTLGDEIKALQETIDARALAIEEKNKEYKKLVGEAIAGVAGGPAGWIMIIFSSIEAERIRKERNEMRKYQQADIALMAKKNRILASLGRVRMDMQDLDLIAIDADIATHNLITVWNKLGTFIQESSQEVDNIHDALTFRRFRNNFRLVVAPWDTIQQDAAALLRLFAQADKEFREEYGV